MLAPRIQNFHLKEFSKEGPTLFVTIMGKGRRALRVHGEAAQKGIPL
jgi:hypothetical protein